MRVLVAEDDARLAEVIARGLREGGLAVDTVHDGAAALSAAMAAPYDVVVLDVMLPRADGMAVTRELRQRRVGVPVLMLTARDAIADRVQGLEAGADDYMIKPFALKELLARVRALSRRHLSGRSAQLVAGSITIDAAARRAFVHGHPLELTAKEFAILEFFVHNQARLVTKGLLIGHVWDYDFEGTENLVEVYIGRLRRKLAEAGAPNPFVTVRGSGYRFEPQR